MSQKPNPLWRENSVSIALNPSMSNSFLAESTAHSRYGVAARQHARRSGGGARRHQQQDERRKAENGAVVAERGVAACGRRIEVGGCIWFSAHHSALIVQRAAECMLSDMYRWIGTAAHFLATYSA